MTSWMHTLIDFILKSFFFRKGLVPFNSLFKKPSRVVLHNYYCRHPNCIIIMTIFYLDRMFSVALIPVTSAVLPVRRQEFTIHIKYQTMNTKEVFEKIC